MRLPGSLDGWIFSGQKKLRRGLFFSKKKSQGVKNASTKTAVFVIFLGFKDQRCVVVKCMCWCFTSWVVVISLFFVSKNSKNHLETRSVAKGPWVNARNATTLGVASAPRAGAGIGTEKMVLTTKEALPKFHSNSPFDMRRGHLIIKVWGDRKLVWQFRGIPP